METVLRLPKIEKVPSQGLGNRAGVAFALTDKVEADGGTPHEEGVRSERFRHELDEVLAGVGEEQDPVEAVARLGARLILQQALEDEVTEFVGRARYERVDGGGRRSTATVSGQDDRRTMSGRCDRASAGSRREPVGFESEVLGKGVARTHALEALIICSFLRGLLVRDVEAHRPS